MEDHEHTGSSETNCSDHSGRSYIISDKNGQTEQKAHTQDPNNYREEIKKGTGCLEDIFMQTMLMEHKSTRVTHSRPKHTCESGEDN